MSAWAARGCISHGAVKPPPLSGIWSRASQTPGCSGPHACEWRSCFRRPGPGLSVCIPNKLQLRLMLPVHDHTERARVLTESRVASQGGRGSSERGLGVAGAPGPDAAGTCSFAPTACPSAPDSAPSLPYHMVSFSSAELPGSLAHICSPWDTGESGTPGCDPAWPCCVSTDYHRLNTWSRQWLTLWEQSVLQKLVQRGKETAE